jgi:hypothetical protein
VLVFSQILVKQDYFVAVSIFFQFVLICSRLRQRSFKFTLPAVIAQLTENNKRLVDTNKQELN